jgi:16S rRNA processing protein RimM
VRGEVKVKSFTADPRRIGAYGPVEDESGTRKFKLQIRGEVRGLLIARLAEIPPDAAGSAEGRKEACKEAWVEDRNAAEALKGLRLYVGRDRLPKLKRGEWYLADLVGLRVERRDGTAMGKVRSVQDHGAGTIVEIETTKGQTTYLPFTKRAVPEVDVDGGRIVVDPPDEVEWKGDENENE